MLEAKAMLALVLQRFAFVVAPEYVYAPTDFLALQPLLGFPVVLKLLDPARSPRSALATPSPPCGEAREPQMMLMFCSTECHLRLAQ